MQVPIATGMPSLAGLWTDYFVLPSAPNCLRTRFGRPATTGQPAALVSDFVIIDLLEATEGHMTLRMPELDAGVLARRDEVIAALRAIVPGEGVIASERAMRPYESRWAHRLPPASHGGRAAGDHRSGRARAALLPRARHQGGAARGRNVALWWRASARRRRPARHGEIQPHSRDRFRQSRGRGRAGRYQPRASPRPSSMPASITRPTRPRRSPARSAAMLRRTPAACIA